MNHPPIHRTLCFCCKEVEPMPLGRKYCDWCLNECTNEGCTRPAREPSTDCEDVCSPFGCIGACGV